MTHSKLISIVLPTYNHLKFLPQAIESILTQTYPHFELIIINDGSTDGTDQFLKKLEGFDERVQILHQENQGLPATLNRGFDLAKGEYLTWVSADNYQVPYFLEALKDALDANPEVGMAYSAFTYIDKDSKVLGSVLNEGKNFRKFLFSCGIAAFMYRRTVKEAIGNYDISLFCAEDWDYWLRLSYEYPLVFVQESLLFYRVHQNSLTQLKKNTVFEKSLAIFKKYYDKAVNPLDLYFLYPSLKECKDHKEAIAHALFDFGASILYVRYANAALALPFLEAALEKMPNDALLLYNMAYAYALLKEWEKMRGILKLLKNGRCPKEVLIFVDKLEEVPNNFNVLEDCLVLKLTESSSELLRLEKKHYLTWSYTKNGLKK
ncbi:hypothetical protein DID77_03730 [Candidatus Marinamargulisbacteria bacterium SCGC AG-439-L15]|nr:hypothetical protein DID77_03730 [Candidatus Marinamargulisbacteria bacterium SCGC AG-439-L15]